MLAPLKLGRYDQKQGEITVGEGFSVPIVRHRKLPNPLTSCGWAATAGPQSLSSFKQAVGNRRWPFIDPLQHMVENE